LIWVLALPLATISNNRRGTVIGWAATEGLNGKSTQHQKTATERPGKAHQGRKAAGKVKIQTR
jgi:hypothetical protein